MQRQPFRAAVCKTRHILHAILPQDDENSMHIGPISKKEEKPLVLFSSLLDLMVGRELLSATRLETSPRIQSPTMVHLLVGVTSDEEEGEIPTFVPWMKIFTSSSTLSGVCLPISASSCSMPSLARSLYGYPDQNSPDANRTAST